MVWRRISVSNSPAEATTRPIGSTNALMPEMAAFTYQRPVSIARICDICRCCALAAVKPYDALFTGTTTNPAPSLHDRPGDRRERVLEADRRAERRQARAREQLVPCPGVRSTGTWSIASIHPSRERNGMYSPNGTRWVLS